jgi:hypothetical protein
VRTARSLLSGSEVSEKFIVDLAVVINREIMDLQPVLEEHAVVSVCCAIDDLRFMSNEERSEISLTVLRWAYQTLRAEVGNSAC